MIMGYLNKKTLSRPETLTLLETVNLLRWRKTKTPQLFCLFVGTGKNWPAKIFQEGNYYTHGSFNPKPLKLLREDILKNPELQTLLWRSFPYAKPNVN